MPITVVVRRGEGASGTRLTFDGMQRVVIGRGSGCDVRLPETSVSLRHASLRSRGADFVIFDEGSTNGTFIGDAKIAPGTSRIVRSGDMVRLGRVWIEVRIDQGPVTRDLAAATRDVALALVSRALAARGCDLTTSVRVLEGPDQGVVLALHDEKRAYTIGRAANCDLALSDEDASLEHARLTRRGKLVSIRSLGAKNGTWLGDVRVEDERDWPWKPSQMLRIGRTVLALEEPVAQALAHIESAPDEALDPNTPVEAPDAQPPVAAANLSDPSAIASDGDPIADDAAGGPASVRATGEAGTPGPPDAVAMPPRRLWSITDLVVMGAAVSMLALSIAGLVWLLR